MDLSLTPAEVFAEAPACVTRTLLRLEPDPYTGEVASPERLRPCYVTMESEDSRHLVYAGDAPRRRMHPALGEVGADAIHRIRKMVLERRDPAGFIRLLRDIALNRSMADTRQVLLNIAQDDNVFAAAEEKLFPKTQSSFYGIFLGFPAYVLCWSVFICILSNRVILTM